MTDIDRLLQTYIERFQAGGPLDPTDLLDQAEGPDRAALSALIEGYLEHAAPAQEWDPDAFEGSVAERAAEMVRKTWEREAAALPGLLVSSRKEAKLNRAEIVSSLATKLGFPKQEEKVATYYNAMEHGRLPPQGVSAKVFDALAGILGTSDEALRRAGESVASPPGGDPGAAYARTTRLGAPAPGQASPPTRVDESAGEEDWDEVDLLFRGGDLRGGGIRRGDEA